MMQLRESLGPSNRELQCKDCQYRSSVLGRNGQAFSQKPSMLGHWPRAAWGECALGLEAVTNLDSTAAEDYQLLRLFSKFSRERISEQCTSMGDIICIILNMVKKIEFHLSQVSSVN